MSSYIFLFFGVRLGYEAIATFLNYEISRTYSIKKGILVPYIMSTHPVMVDYRLPFENMIAVGNYSWSSSEINAMHFPFTGKRRIRSTMTLVLFDEYMESKEVIRALNEMKLRAARLPEFLAFGARYPDLQNKFPIVGLGSVWKDPYDRGRVPILWNDFQQRHLDLGWFDYPWAKYYCFAAVYKRLRRRVLL